MRLDNPGEACKSIGVLRNLDASSDAVAEVLREIKEYLAEQSSFGEISYKECFQGTNLRRTVLGMSMGFATIATGITFWFGYGTTFFIAAGINNAYLVSLILALVNAAFTGPSIYLVERLGRRALLFGGGTIMGITQLTSGIVHCISPHSAGSQKVLIVCTVVFIASYAPSWGTVGK